MTAGEKVSVRLQQQLVAERDRLGWSQSTVATRLTARGVPGMYAPTIAKIELGHRAVRADELAAFADLYSVSTDALLGRSNGSDVVWAASRLASEAQRIAGDLVALGEKVSGGMQDLQHYAQRERQEGEVSELVAAAQVAYASLTTSAAALGRLADEFPLGGIGVRK